MTGRPSRSRPSATGNSRSSFHWSASSNSRNRTTRDCGLGTSTPTMSLPGMRATRIERALILSARSSAKLTSRFILTPGRRRTPYWVTTGPVVRPATSPSTLNSASVSSSRSCRTSSSPSLTACRLSGLVSSFWWSHTRGSSGSPSPPACSVFLSFRARALGSSFPSPRPSLCVTGTGGSPIRLAVASWTAAGTMSPLPGALFRLASVFCSALGTTDLPSAPGCRSSRCSGCQANVARVSADSARKPTSTAPAGPMPCGISTAKKPGITPTRRPRNRRLSRSKMVIRPSTPARYGSSTLSPMMRKAERFMSNVPRRSNPASARPTPNSGRPSAPAPSQPRGARPGSARSVR